jgi:AcrR family transcriptional regulator
VLAVASDASPAAGPGRVHRQQRADLGPLSERRIKIVDATLACLAQSGTSKTTVDDISKAAGVSRATVYREFPGGREQLLAAVVDTEVARLFSALGVRLGEASNLAEALVGGIVEASTRIREHAALAYLVEHEPGVVLGHLAFDDSERLFSTVSRFTAPFLARWVSASEAGRVAEWAARIVLSYAISPSSALDLTDPADASRMVDVFMLPGICALHDAGVSGAIDITPFQTDPETSETELSAFETDRSDRSDPSDRSDSSDRSDPSDPSDRSDSEPRLRSRTEQGDKS